MAKVIIPSDLMARVVAGDEKSFEELYRLTYKRAYEDNSQNPLWKYMVEYFVDRYTREAMRILGEQRLDTRLHYSIRLYCHGAVGMTREWLLEDNITPAETIVEMMFYSMPEGLQKIFFR